MTLPHFYTRHRTSALVLLLFAAACTAPGCGGESESSGDGDGDAGDGDGDAMGDGDSPSGDGDGDAGDGDGDAPSGDGDGDLPSGDGDGDGDTATGGSNGTGGGPGMGGAIGGGGMGGVPASTVTVSVAVEGDGTGAVVSDPIGLYCGDICSVEFDESISVRLTAGFEDDTLFAGWSGSCEGMDPICVLPAGEAAQATATFSAKPVLTAVSTGGGKIISDPVAIDCGETCEAYFEPGTNVSLSLSVDPDYYFVGWSGACSGAHDCDVNMNEAKEVTATFADSTGESVSCGLQNDVGACTNGPITNAILGMTTAEECQSGCETALLNKGIGTGCWVLAANGNCYCRSGELRSGSGTRPGGSCNILTD